MKDKLLKVLKYVLANKTKIIANITATIVVITEIVALCNGTSIGLEAAKIIGVM